jgi:hypothetical protein
MIFDSYNLLSAQPCEVDLLRSGIGSRKFQLSKSIYFDIGNQ